MKRININLLLIISSCVFYTNIYSQSFFTLNIEGQNGSTSSLKSLEGKRVLLVISALDSDIDLTGLQELQKAYPDLVVLELPVKNLAKSSLKSKQIKTDITIAKEINDSTDVNGRLLKWLIRKEENSHFNIENLQIGQKYFVDGKGELYAVMPPGFKLNDPRIHAVLTRSEFLMPENN